MDENEREVHDLPPTQSDERAHVEKRAHTVTAWQHADRQRASGDQQSGV